MASKKRGRKKKTEIQELSEFIRDHMVAKSDLADIRKEMATKTDIAELKRTLDEHTRDLNIIKNDVKSNLDKRLALQVRVTNLEKKVLGASQEPAHQ